MVQEGVAQAFHRRLWMLWAIRGAIVAGTLAAAGLLRDVVPPALEPLSHITFITNFSTRITLLQLILLAPILVVAAAILRVARQSLYRCPVCGKDPSFAGLSFGAPSSCGACDAVLAAPETGGDVDVDMRVRRFSFSGFNLVLALGVLGFVGFVALLAFWPSR